MAKNLVIVESPTKAKIISKFLGKDYKVLSSYGHIRDLPTKKADLPPSKRTLPYASLAIDVENNFEPLYITLPRQKKQLGEIKKHFEADTTLWIATDEDREGEAIGWHLLQVLKPKKTNDVKRIVFHEITRDAILHSIETPREINESLVFSQQARRILDRLVGYELSPLLWKKIRFGLSAGRVQSVAVKLIVDREREIQAFNAEEYWTIDGLFNKDKINFKAQFQKIDGKKFVPKNKAESDAVLDAIKGKQFEVSGITEKDTKRSPAAPFTTSTLQQEASRKLGFSVKKTMTVAQKLYEGGSTGTGLITYMRTDSTSLSDKALKDAKSVIEKEFGKDYSLVSPRIYKKKQKGAQEAHEAVRPTEISVKPDDIASKLTADELKLYDLIWKRTVACQMQEAKLKNTAVDLGVKANKTYTFRATGQRVVFPGFLALYIEGEDTDNDDEKTAKDFEKKIPELNEGEMLKADKIEPKQHFTKPPARYTEASLVKKMEEEGIGRPSTYAPTISTVQSRGYVQKDGKALSPTDTAFVVTELLEKHFENIVNLKFTANMEEDLDKIATENNDYIEFLNNFYKPFHDLIGVKDKEIKKSDIISEKTDEVCELCGKPMEIKLSRFGKFLSCTGFPDCKHAKPLHEDPEAEKEMELLEKEFENEKCEKCGEKMVVKKGRFGTFLACSGYPKCKTTKPILKSIGVKCPACKKGDIVEKKSKRGKVFWGCERYPDCDYSSWEKPKAE
ncbi:MAG: type I DNA topoisomerase [Candidatus Gracilibacteria bacterium]|jgi:DNA topoisomerase-1|nr:type I DNA topoisomerase [Candidatus Gracilibacteria bacterium]